MVQLCVTRGAAAAAAAAVRPAAAAVGAAGAGGGARMAAWRVHSYGGARELRLEEARVPPLRAPDELLVRVHAASLNPLDGAMLGGYGRRGLNALRALEAARGGSGGGGGDVEFPLVVGRDFVGRVERAGPAVPAPKRRGARVWGVLPPHWPGAHQQLVVTRANWVGAAPALGPLAGSAAAGGALYTALTACSALRAAGLPPGRRATAADGGPARVLLLGLGGVGQAALQLLHHSGHEVVVGCAGEQCALAERLGAAAALDRHQPEYGERLIARGPYRAVVDAAGLGGREAGARGWRFARYVTLTTPLLRYMDELGPALGGAAAAAELARQCAAAAAAAAAAAPPPRALPPPHVRWAYFAPCTQDIELVRRLAERGAWHVQVERAFPYRDAPAAYEHAARGHARGKLLLLFDELEARL